MVGGIVAAITVMDNAFVSLPALLVAFTVKLEVPAAVGVPEINPADESVKPVGRLPLCNVHVMGVSPVAVSCALYAVPVVPLGKVVVVMTGAVAASKTATNSTFSVTVKV